MTLFRNLLLFVLGATTVIALVILSSYNDKDSLEADRTDLDSTIYLDVKVPEIPDSMTFAGELVPMQTMDMRERFDRELLSISFRHSMTIHSIKLANRYFPMIEEILAKHEVPDDFKYLAVTESNLRNATSPAGAQGIWQFMPATARSYGLLVNKEIDERNNFYKVTEAACKLLKRLKKKFGSWTLAAAAYNCGEGRVQERMRNQGGKTYYDLVLPKETMRYVPRIVATKAVLSNPKKYGFDLKESDLYPALPTYEKIQIQGSVASWVSFCKEHQISYRTLTLHNPWIKGYALTNGSGKKYEVLIPEK